ncbi:hypothetical protein MASR1M101_12080 [Gemmatimonas sp.]
MSLNWRADWLHHSTIVTGACYVQPRQEHDLPKESACGWCKDKWGLNWQITPVALTKAISHADAAVAKRAFEAMMTMHKIDIAAIEAAVRGATA